MKTGRKKAGFKRAAAAALVSLTFVACCSVVTGAEVQTSIVIHHEIDGVEQPLQRGVQPRFKYFISISARLDEENGKSTSTGSALVNTDYSNTLSLNLERTTDDVHWSILKGWSIKDTGRESMVLERQWYINKGYDYQAATTIFVDTGEHTEKATCISSTLYY